jgi:hypothetical protein
LKLQDVAGASRAHLSNEEFQELQELLAKYEDIFVVDGEIHILTNKVNHHTDMGDTRPIRQPWRRLPLAK